VKGRDLTLGADLSTGATVGAPQPCDRRAAEAVENQFHEPRAGPENAGRFVGPLLGFPPKPGPSRHMAATVIFWQFLKSFRP
jgi:hypothetical protein